MTKMRYLFEVYYKKFTTKLFCCSTKKEIEKFIKDEKLTKKNIKRIEKSFINEENKIVKTKIYNKCNGNLALTQIKYHYPTEKFNIKTGD